MTFGGNNTKFAVWLGYKSFNLNKVAFRPRSFFKGMKSSSFHSLKGILSSVVVFIGAPPMRTRCQVYSVQFSPHQVEGGKKLTRTDRSAQVQHFIFVNNGYLTGRLFSLYKKLARQLFSMK